MLNLSICFVLWRGDNKSGGWGDILRVRSDTRSHEWGPWVYQWDQQGWCEFSYSQGNEINKTRIVLMSQMRTRLFTEDVFGCSKNSSWSLVPSTQPPLLRYGKKTWMFSQMFRWNPGGELKSTLACFSFTYRDIGVMVKLYPNMSPVLLHNSQLDHKRVCRFLP